MLPGRDEQTTTNKQWKIVLLSQWTLEAEFRNFAFSVEKGSPT